MSAATERTPFVAGFLIDPVQQVVALVRKQRPAWQAGRLNAIGGHVEPGESFDEAMRREFVEETGVDRDDWQHFATVCGDWGEVRFYRAFGDVDQARTTTDEPIEHWWVPNVLTSADILPNLTWLLPLALYRHDVYEPVVAREGVSR